MILTSVLSLTLLGQVVLPGSQMGLEEAQSKFGFRSFGMRTMNTSPAFDGTFSTRLGSPSGGDLLRGTSIRPLG